MEEELNKKTKIIIGIILSLLCLGFQALTYKAADFFINIFNLNYNIPKIDKIDNLIPLLTIFIVPYILAYVYWIIAPVCASIVNIKHLLNIILAYIIINIIAFIIFLIYPTYINRIEENIYNENPNDFFGWLSKIIYDSDGKEKGYNLFPSMHCMTTTICFFATFRKKEIPLWYRICSFIIAILICLSTVFVKQHYIIDSLVGILIAISVWLIINKFNLGYKLLNKPIYYFINKFKNKEKKENE